MPRYESVYAPTNSKKDRQFCCKFTYLFVVPKQGAVEALPFPAGGSPTAKICPKGKLTNDGIWKFSENSVSELCRVTSPFTPPPIAKKTGDCLSFLLLVGAVGLEPMTSTMSR